MPDSRPAPKVTPRQRKLIEAASAIRTARPADIDFLHTIRCQCGIPYTNPGEDVRAWERKQGHATLRIEAGAAIDPRSGKFVEVGLPYGEKPRLVLIHLASEAVRTKNPVVDVEGSMTAFARSLGLDTNGPSLRHLKDQLARLAAATVRMGLVEEGRAVQVNTQIVSAFDLWYPAEPDQRVLWPSTVRLSEEYFQSLSRHAVPLDRRAVGALATASAHNWAIWGALREGPHRRTPGPGAGAVGPHDRRGHPGTAPLTEGPPAWRPRGSTSKPSAPTSSRCPTPGTSATGSTSWLTSW
ncbi:replication protein RepA [Urbifossiella limnaea]|uniref:replication protein RepA n=1 Tax=Urbifossiella limnaea TaxID=2528023 RepID=UPI0011A94C8B|nr:replication protein RepA [Urbifossiella limnaea]